MSFVADPGLGYDSTEELMFAEDSGSSMGAGSVDMETSVDATLEDDEYLEQIEQRVFSPDDHTGVCALGAHTVHVCVM